MADSLNFQLEEELEFSSADDEFDMNSSSVWKILIADDDEGVHSVTELVFNSFSFDNRPIQFINTYSGKETLEVLQKEEDIAVILLDVVMETDDAGLRVVEQIRKELKNNMVRIILRTGQPGQAPEEQVLIDYDINDYKNKSELTSRKLKSSVITSLRSYISILKINELNTTLERKVAERTAELAASLEIIEKDEEAGKKIQFKLLPEDNMEIGGITFSREIFPSLYLSGDFVDYFRINERFIGFYIADVSGHGASSAFITVYLKSMISGFIGSYNHNNVELILKPDELLNVINQTLIKEDLGKYLTIFYGLIDLEKNELHYSTGGQFPFPVLLDRKSKDFIRFKGPPVGLLRIARYKKEILKLPRDFSLIFMSDGILELLKDKTLKEQESQLLKILTYESTVTSLIENIGIDSTRFLPDDITILNVRRTASE
ncbi:SpoIIE family protein phosphatase [Spirochaeta isovalerica]|uniref:Serine phosphatase RsbU (Regulator of sigma subunit) n=1 Tax=Spirochaeta isovalerica TaxID=150 RepID=A0A841R7L3_9SPIO|nr:SpoIIE family protein phosphatase [Spirochaeta isovalerica]MBB6481254.1 serine phosphatase RsbU (regulator of sigma subunit) [Spirochaeta isovalerica]